jgi:hypothetical protein
MEGSLGEAKRRKDKEKVFGLVPRKGFGLVISPPMEISGENISGHGGLDPQELRFSLLFWDRLVWPDNNMISIASGDEAQFLERVGILKRPRIEIRESGQMSTLFAKAHLKAFEDLARAEPGLWGLAQGEKSFLIRDQSFAPTGGTEFNLYQAIPVPDKDVPLPEILEFRQKRRDELLRLRIEMDAIFTKIAKRADETGFKKAINEVDAACVDVLKVAKETYFPLRFVDLKQYYSIDLVTVLGPALTAYLAAENFKLGTVAAVAAAWGAVKLNGATAKIETGGLTWTPNPVQNHPFRYVSSYHREIFNRD